jgi:hypothetical protein
MAKRVEAGSGVRRSATQGRALVERWRASGESVTSFCRRTGVGAHVLRYWLGRDTGAGERVGGPSDFFVVTTPQRSPGTAAVESAREMAVAESRMAFIVVVPAASPAMLARTVRELLAEARS